MPLPSITPSMIQQRMTTAWAIANKLWRRGKNHSAGFFMKEYDYLSHWQNG